MTASSGNSRRVVVVSALGGVTDQLITAIENRLARKGNHSSVVAVLRDRHAEVIEAIVPADERAEVTAQLDAGWKELQDMLEGIGLLGECTPRTRDTILSLGERASAPLVACAFKNAGYDAVALDARTLIRTDNAFGEANVEFDNSARLITTVVDELVEGTIAVVTGFIGSTANGETTTLGRSGSDYTATILGRTLRAERVEIWTDVDGGIIGGSAGCTGSLHARASELYRGSGNGLLRCARAASANDAARAGTGYPAIDQELDEPGGTGDLDIIGVR